MTDTSIPSPPAAPLTFEAAIAQTQILLEQWQQGSLSELDLGAAIALLVSTQNGARGFFVTSLTHANPLMDQPPPAVLQALQSSLDIVAELLVKNLAMSSAMAVTHRRNHNEALAQGSDQVQARSTLLIRLLHSPMIVEKVNQLHASIVTGAGDYQAFLTRWGYDAEQLQVIRTALERAIAD